MLRSIKRFKEFDKVTEFRLWNSLFVAFGMELLVPIIISLKGLYMATWIISAFMIANTLAVKANNYIVNKYSLDSMYKMGIFIHLGFILISSIYFFNPVIMIWLDSTLAIIETALFSSYSIALNNYLTDNYPNDMKDFQIVRNSSWADSSMLGALLITGLTAISLGVGVISFIVYNTIFSLWLMKNWNFYKDIEYIKE